MATKFWGAGGSNSNNGDTRATAYETQAFAITNTIANDTIIEVDGTAVHPSGHDSLLSPRIFQADNYRKGVLQPNASETGFVERTGGTAAAGLYEFKDHVFDGLGQVNVVFQVGNTANNADILFTGCEFKNADGQHGIGDFQQHRKVTLVNCKLQGVPSNTLLTTDTLSSNDGDQDLVIQGMELDCLSNQAGTVVGIQANKENALTNLMNVNISGVTGKLSALLSSAIVGIQCNGIVDPLVSNCDFTIESDSNTDEAFGIELSGKSVAICSDANISGNTINFNAPAGFCIALGKSTSASFTTGGLVSGNRVNGKFFASDTPHNFLVGQATTGKMQGNESVDGYVGYLISKTTTADIQGNLAFDCYGPSYYVKGATDATLRGNTAVVTGKFTQRDCGILSVVAQGATDTAAATLEENLVIVRDVSKIHALAEIGDVNQVCSFIRNTYIIPDTVDVATADLFDYESGTANNTLAEWNAQTEITDDRIVQLPIAEINKLINDLRPAVSFIGAMVKPMIGA